MPIQHSPPRRSPRNLSPAVSLPVTVSTVLNSVMSTGEAEGVNVVHMPPVPNTSSSTAGTSSASTTVVATTNTSVSATTQPATSVANPATNFLSTFVPPPLTPAPGTSMYQPPMMSRSITSQPDMESLQRQIDMLQVQLMNAKRALEAAATNTTSVTGHMVPSSSSAPGMEANNFASGSSNNSPGDIGVRPNPSPFSFVSTDATVSPCFSNQQQLMAAQPINAQPQAETHPMQQHLMAAQPINAQPQAATHPMQQQLLAAQSLSVQPPSAIYPMQQHRKIIDLPEFSGVPEDWPMFSTAFDHTTAAYGYSHFENCLRLQKTLKGEARDSVKSLLIHPNNVPTVMEQLKIQYGRPELLIRCQLQQVREIAAIGENAVEKLIPFAVKIQNLAAFLTTANGHQHLSNPTLMDELIQKLPMSKRLEWAQYASRLQQWPTVIDFSNWINGVANLVRSVQSFSVNTSRQASEPRKKMFLHASDGQQKEEEECPLCRGQHKLPVCKKFVSLSVPNRWNEVKKLRLCFSCLGGGHSSRNCRRRKECPMPNCQRRHNKLLHDSQSNNFGGNNANVSTDASGPNAEPVLSCVSTTKEKCDPLFRVLPVTIYGPNCSIETFALLDEGSSVTMLDSSLVRQLGLQGRQSNLNLSWYGGKSSQEIAMVIDLHLPTQCFKVDASKNYGVPISSYNNATPRLLIGLDHCYLGLPDEIVPLEESGPYAANTPLGWVVFGQVRGMQSTPHTCLLTVQPEQNLHELVANYFETENFGVKALPVLESNEDIRAKKLLKDSTVRVGEKYQARLLWREDEVVLPDSYSMALNRLIGMERKMKKNPEFGAAYKAIMSDYVEKRYVRKISSKELTNFLPRTWYLPHFGVVNPNKPGKLRLVFDAAAKVEGVSLNSKLLKGPQQYKPLPSVLFNFRVGAIAVCGDIKEMFHQIVIAPEDRCSQRFLWREDENSQPEVYEMTVMTFGAACSPCIAQYVKEKNALDFRDRFPRAVNAILDHHYVDDFVDSFEDVPKAIEIAKQVRGIHKSAGFELRNFMSNSSEVVVALEGSPNKMFSFSGDSKQLDYAMEKILGMFWHPVDDAFKFACKFHRVNADIINGQRCPTKRELLSVMMSVFDPIGFLCPFMINAKLLWREIWRCNARWDEEIPKELKQVWSNWLQDLQNVSQFQVPRTYFGVGVPVELELHTFVDASEDAFGAVSYWRYITADGKVGLTFISAKTKCAPLKTMTVPRLELQAAVLGTRLMCTILREHSLKVARSICWSDSTTVINWIGSESRRYKPFVAHRITEILDSTRPADWKWLPTDLNVADELTRMKNNIDFSFGTRWFQGPSFLLNHEDDWPKYSPRYKDDCRQEELRPKFIFMVCTDSIIDFNRFSSFLRLKRTMAWVLRFVDRCCKKSPDDATKCLSAAELRRAELCICRLAQKESFAEEIEALRSGGSIQKSNDLYTLSPYIDESNCLRVYGRIDAASWLPLDFRRPIILSSNHQLSKLIAVHVHSNMRHQNFEATLGQIRQKFWIPRLRRLLSQCISDCYLCKIRRANAKPPYMGPLPMDRLTPYVRPFTYTGVDYFGPVNVTIGRRKEKRWVALFTCLTIRAVHLEVAFDLSTDACILTIRNFINRRGTPLKMRSDNGKNFVGVDKEAKRFNEVFDLFQIEDEMSAKGITWEFNCPHNPSEGGIWERMVQCVKKVLRVTLKEMAPKEHTLQSLLIEAENIVNSRPLTHLPVSHEDEEPLTPNHFLLGVPNTAQTPEGTIIDKPAVLRKQWRISRQLRDHFWKRWIIEYLPTLTRRSKWCEYTKPVATGDLVIICDPAVSRREWKRGRVVEVFKGSDGVIRRANVQTSSGVHLRPVSKLAVLDFKK